MLNIADVLRTRELAFLAAVHATGWWPVGRANGTVEQSGRRFPPHQRQATITPPGPRAHIAAVPQLPARPHHFGAAVRVVELARLAILPQLLLQRPLAVLDGGLLSPPLPLVRRRLGHLQRHLAVRFCDGQRESCSKASDKHGPVGKQGASRGRRASLHPCAHFRAAGRPGSQARCSQTQAPPPVRMPSFFRSSAETTLGSSMLRASRSCMVRRMSCKSRHVLQLLQPCRGYSYTRCPAKAACRQDATHAPAAAATSECPAPPADAASAAWHFAWTSEGTGVRQRCGGQPCRMPPMPQLNGPLSCGHPMQMRPKPK